MTLEELKAAYHAGAKIQYKFAGDDAWEDCLREPTWNPRLSYRVKPGEMNWKGVAEFRQGMLLEADVEIARLKALLARKVELVVAPVDHCVTLLYAIKVDGVVKKHGSQSLATFDNITLSVDYNDVVGMVVGIDVGGVCDAVLTRGRK